VERRRVPLRRPVHLSPAIATPGQLSISRAERYVSSATVEHWTRSYCVGPRAQFCEATSPCASAGSTHSSSLTSGWGTVVRSGPPGRHR
jgi:hypothetical protein